jgi:hypothetical protein
MIRALIDPSVLVPPSEESALPWLRSLREWSRALREFDAGVVGSVMSLETQAGLAAATGGLIGIRQTLDRIGSPLGAPDVMKLIEGIRARAAIPGDVFEPSEVLFNTLDLNPEYLDSGDPYLCETFADDLGHAAAFTKETNVQVTAVTTRTAWSEEAEAVAVTGQVEAWEKYGLTEELSGKAGTVSEPIALWESPRDADAALREAWPELLEHPELGVEVAYREFTSRGEERARPLTFKVGESFVSSMEAMGYTGKSGRIKAVFHAAAHIGCKRVGDLQSLEGHPYRKSEGANSAAVEREDGAKLMRGSLGKDRNAHRLMWWDAPVPVILGVVEHDANPLHLT